MMPPILYHVVVTHPRAEHAHFGPNLHDHEGDFNYLLEKLAH